MLMNLSRMRDFHWTGRLAPLLKKYRYNITWGDQDIINIIFSDNPGMLFLPWAYWDLGSERPFSQPRNPMTVCRLDNGALSWRARSENGQSEKGCLAHPKIMASFWRCFVSDKLYIFGCEWNYRPDHCMYSSTCSNAERFGASILHGSRGYFHADKQPTFKAVYDAFKQVNPHFPFCWHDLHMLISVQAWIGSQTEFIW